MKRFKNILYFADGAAKSCNAFDRAVALATGNRARLTVFDVLPEEPAGIAVQNDSDIPILKLMLDERRAQLEAMVQAVGSVEPEMQIRVGSGIAFVEVIRAVLNNCCDLVIKTSRPPESFTRRVLGSTDLHLLRKCPCPVWIERLGAAKPYRSILAAVDPTDTANVESDRLIMDLATSLTEREEADLAVVHAWRLHGEDLLRRGHTGISAVELDMLLDGTREQHRGRLDALLGHYGIEIDNPQVHLVKGEPAASIRRLSEELKADLVVMGTLGRRGIPGVFIGNTAEDVLQTTEASVLAIKPLGFVSPVSMD